MENEIIKILNGLTDETMADKAYEAVNRLKRLDYAKFISSVLKITTESDEKRIKDSGEAVLYSAAMHDSTFHNPEVLELFWPQLAQSVVSLWDYSFMQMKYNSMLSAVVAQVVISIQQLGENEAVVDFLVQIVNDRPDLISFVAETIADVSSNGLHNLSFPEDFLFSILTTNFYIRPRIRFFVAIAIQMPEHPQLPDIFAELLNDTPESDLLYVLGIIHTLFETKPMFFKPFIYEFIDNLRRIACDTGLEVNCRCKALLFFKTIGDKLPKIYISNLEIFQLLTATLLDIMAEINEDAPLVRTQEHIEPYFEAVDAFYCVYKDNSNHEIYNIFSDIASQMLENKQGWNILYAVLSGLIQVIKTVNIGSTEGEGTYEMIKSRVEPYLKLIDDKSFHPIIRLTALDLLIALNAYGAQLYDGLLQFYIQPLLLFLKADEITAIREKAACALYSIIQSCISKIKDDYLMTIFNEILKEIPNGTEEMIKTLICAICIFFKKPSTNFETELTNFTQIIKTLVDSIDNDKFTSFFLKVYASTIESLTIPKKLVPYVVELMNYAFQIRSRADNSDDETIINTDYACRMLIKHLHEFTSEFMDPLFKSALTFAQINLEPVVVEVLREEEFPSSMVIIQSRPGTRSFVEKRVIERIQSSLYLMYSIIMRLNDNDHPYIEKALAIVDRWITYKYHSHIIKCSAWHLFVACIQKTYDPAVQLLEIDKFIDMFIVDIRCSYPFHSMVLLYKRLRNIIEQARKLGWNDVDRIRRLLSLIQSTLTLCDKNKALMLSNIQKWDVQKKKQDRKEESIEELSYTSIRIFHELLNINQPVVVEEFLKQNSTISEYLSIPSGTIPSTLLQWTAYLMETRDVKRFNEFVPVFVNLLVDEGKSEDIYMLLNDLIDYFVLHEIEREPCITLFNTLVEVVHELQETDPETDNLTEERGIIAVAILINSNKKVLWNEENLFIFLELMPFHLMTQWTEMVFEFMFSIFVHEPSFLDEGTLFTLFQYVLIGLLRELISKKAKQSLIELLKYITRDPQIGRIVLNALYDAADESKQNCCQEKTQELLKQKKRSIEMERRRPSPEPDFFF